MEESSKVSTTTKDQAISISMGLDISQLVMAGGIIRKTININIIIKVLYYYFHLTYQTKKRRNKNMKKFAMEKGLEPVVEHELA